LIDRLIDGITKTENPTVLGLDTCIEYLPDSSGINSFEEAAGAILGFNKSMIDAAIGLIPAVKLQIAYYEMYGPAGLQAYIETINYARKAGLVVMLDCKRNDIGATAACYSKAYLGKTALPQGEIAAYDGDFLTVTPYLGEDGIFPFVEDCKKYGKGIFILVKTSNPSSGQLQDKTLSSGEKIYELMGDYVADWGKDLIGGYGYSNVGAVVGATYPAQGEQLRRRLPSVFFLIPGYGAQGASGADIAGCFDSNGLGGIVNASRSLLCAYRKEAGLSPAKAMKKEALKMREDIMGAIRRA